MSVDYGIVARAFKRLDKYGVSEEFRRSFLSDPWHRKDSDFFMGNIRRTTRIRPPMPGEDHPNGGPLPEHCFIVVQKVEPHKAPYDAAHIKHLRLHGIVWCERRVVPCLKVDLKEEMRYLENHRKKVGEAIWDKALRFLFLSENCHLRQLDSILEELHPGIFDYTSMEQVYEDNMPKFCRLMAEDLGQEYAEWDWRRRKAEVLGDPFDEPAPRIQ